MAGPITAVPNSFTNGSLTDAPSMNANFASLISQSNTAFSPLTAGQSLNNLFPLSVARGGLGSTSINNLLQRQFASRTSFIQFSGAAASYLTLSFTPISASSQIVIRTKTGVSCALLVMTHTSAQLPANAVYLVSGSTVLVQSTGGQQAITGSSTAQLGVQQVLQMDVLDTGAGGTRVYGISCADLNASGFTNAVTGSFITVEEYG